jgi:hypothetical protein
MTEDIRQTIRRMLAEIRARVLVDATLREYEDRQQAQAQLEAQQALLARMDAEHRRVRQELLEKKRHA